MIATKIVTTGFYNQVICAYKLPELGPNPAKKSGSELISDRYGLGAVK
jgi:hypothetical protein